MALGITPVALRITMDLKSLLFGTARKKSVTIISGAMCCALVLGFVVRGTWSDKATAHDGAVCTVTRGPLEIRINQSGELQAAESIRISPEIKREATIIELVDEGTRVKKDDIIARLDATTLEQQQASQEIEVENAAADLKKAVEDRKIQELTNEVSISKARLDVATARMDIDKYGTVVLGADGFLDKKLYNIEDESDDSLLALDDEATTAAPAVDSSGNLPPWPSVDSSAVISLESTVPGATVESTSPAASASEARAAGAPAPPVDSTGARVESTSPALAPLSADSTGAVSLDSSAPVGVDSTAAAGVDSTDEALIASIGQARINSSGELVFESTAEAASAGTVEKGEAYQAFRDAEVAIRRARTDLRRAKTDFQGMDELLKRGFITKNDFIKAELAVVEADRKLESTKLAYEILRVYTYPKTRAQKEADLKKAEDGFKQAVLQAKSQMAQQDAQITQAQAVYTMKKKNLDDMNDQLAKMTIKAPADGFVLYGDERRPWEKDEIKIGSKAYEGRTLITFPSITNMIAATKVQEKDVYKVKVGQGANVTVPALPGVTLTGKVSKISTVAASGNRWMTSSEAKSFDVEVTLDQSDARMKPGMSCKVSILVDTVADCLYVPVNCVFKQDGKDVCCAVSGGKVVQKAVVTGASCDTYIVVAEGLSEGSKVLMYNASSSELDTSNAPTGGKGGIESTGPAGAPAPSRPSVESTGPSAAGGPPSEARPAGEAVGAGGPRQPSDGAAASAPGEGAPQGDRGKGRKGGRGGGGGGEGGGGGGGRRGGRGQ
jgi:HlyD family secretion protein